MSEIEDAEEFGANLVTRVWNAMASDLAANEVYAMAGKLITARDNAVANAVLDEYMALVNQMVLTRARTGESARLNFFRTAHAELKAKYAPWKP